MGNKGMRVYIYVLDVMIKVVISGGLIDLVVNKNKNII
jgi:hypothetical protein